MEDNKSRPIFFLGIFADSYLFPERKQTFIEYSSNNLKKTLPPICVDPVPGRGDVRVRVSKVWKHGTWRKFGTGALWYNKSAYTSNYICYVKLGM